MMTQTRPRMRFDQSYYARYYGDSSVARQTAWLVEYVCSYLRHLGQPVRRVLDVGCGLGFWRRTIEHYYPKSRYLGIEASDFLCEKYGWKKGSVVDFKSKTPFDLVICQDVLQYLNDEQASLAIRNLGELCAGAMYFYALTKEDWQENCDRRYTDGAVYLRHTAWYRRRLRRHFINAGGCVFVSRRSDIVLFELERLE